MAFRFQITLNNVRAENCSLLLRSRDQLRIQSLVAEPLIGREQKMHHLMKLIFFQIWFDRWCDIMNVFSWGKFPLHFLRETLKDARSRDTQRHSDLTGVHFWKLQTDKDKWELPSFVWGRWEESLWCFAYGKHMATLNRPLFSINTSFDTSSHS